MSLPTDGLRFIHGPQRPRPLQLQYPGGLLCRLPAIKPPR